MSEVIRVLHFSPYNENDGIARYTDQYVKALGGLDGVRTEVFPVSPTVFRGMSSGDRAGVLKQLRKQLKDYDVLHIQHEFGLFAPGDFAELIAAARAAGKKSVVSFHTSPILAIKPAKLGGLGPRSWVMYMRAKRYAKRMMAWHIEPLNAASAVLAHDQNTADHLVQYGVPAGKVHVLPHPVYEFSDPPKTNLITEKLQRKEGDIIYCTVGMMHRYKGIYDAIRALKFLPDNYKLAIIGGVHPLSEDIPMYNKACDLIDTLGLKDRVYITGFITDDNEFNGLIRECDVCVYPYDGKYYAYVSSGAINLAFSNRMPVIAYPTATFSEIAEKSHGADVLTQTFAYYELARELQRIDRPKQIELSKAYANDMAWPKITQKLVEVYESVLR